LQIWCATTCGRPPFSTAAEQNKPNDTQTVNIAGKFKFSWKIYLHRRFRAGDHFPSRADFSSRVSLLFHVLLLKPSSLGKGLVFPTLILPPLFRNS
jgi:hypothetical protein